MIKTVLVGLDGSEHSMAASRYAIYLGQQLKAFVVGLHVIDVIAIEGSFVHDISGSLGFEPYLDFASKMREVLRDRANVILEEFGTSAAAAGVKHETISATGVVPNELAERAKTADLLVIGNRGVNEKFSTGLLGSTAESVTRKSPKPVLVCPATFHEVTRPLLAYDGSHRAAAAMQRAADFCAALSLPLTVLTVNRDDIVGKRTLDEAKSYLRAYDLNIEYELQQTGNAPERIANYLREQNHDMLFIGAYGHGRIIEMVLGSTTEYVLRNSSCPVFLNR